MPIERNYTDTSLVHLLSHDSEHAFQLIFDQYKSKVYSIALMYLKTASSAEEALQDVFLKLWSNRKTLGEIYSIEAWLYTVTKNSILNNLKKQAHETLAEKGFAKQLLLVEDNTDHKIRDAQYQQLIHQAIAKLPLQQQTVYILARENGLSYEKIGLRLSLSPLTVKTHMSRALGSIRLFLKNHGKEIGFVLFFAKTVQ